MSRPKTKFLIYIFIFLAAFFLLFSRPSFFNPVKFSVIKIFAGPVRFLMAPVQEVKKILYYHRTFDEYMRLRQSVHALRARLIGLTELLEENQRLARLLDLKRELIYSSTAATVTARDPSNWNAGLIIDKGERDGVTPGQPVVESLGVVGKIAEVTGDTAKVILVTDPAFSVAALDQRSREVGLVSGTLQGLCQMRYLSFDSDVAVGDMIVTSSASTAFPKGLLIGEISEVFVDKNKDIVYCLIQPSVSLSQIEEVLVIKTK